MGKVYLPHAEQFDLMNENLSKLVTAISSNNDITTWKGIQNVVRSGIAEEVFPVGTLLSARHSKYGNVWFEVVAHNLYESAASKALNTMTLMCVTALDNVQYDAREAFFTFSKEWTGGNTDPGKRYFTLPKTIGSWEAGYYAINITQKTIPKGAQLVILGDSTTPLKKCTVELYESATSASPLGTCSWVEDGSYQISAIGDVNDWDRVAYGSDNYKESAIRQLLNSTAEAGSVWTPQTKFDRAPSWASTHDGFARGFEEEFLAAIGKVFVPCAANNTYESPDSTTMVGEKYTVIDKFYLASQREIFGTSSDIVADDSSIFPYYEGATNVDRIKYREGAAVHWGLRSPTSWDDFNVRYVSSDGSVSSNGAMHSIGIAPLCTIV